MFAPRSRLFASPRRRLANTLSPPHARLVQSCPRGAWRSSPTSALPP